MPSVTWPQALVLCVALVGTFWLASTHNPELASMLALVTSTVALYQRKPGDPTPPNPPAGP